MVFNVKTKIILILICCMLLLLSACNDSPEPIVWDGFAVVEGMEITQPGPAPEFMSMNEFLAMYGKQVPTGQQPGSATLNQSGETHPFVYEIYEMMQIDSLAELAGIENLPIDIYGIIEGNTIIIVIHILYEANVWDELIEFASVTAESGAEDYYALINAMRDEGVQNPAISYLLLDINSNVKYERVFH